MPLKQTNANELRFAAFRKRLTEGFKAIDPDTGNVLEGEAHQRALDSTKPWRGELWKAFNQLERETNPYVALKHEAAAQEKAKNND